ncbi:MAG: site-2 protease family protein [Rhodocyclaceae bacterium]|mgnify:CR=1 FL=1|jgi:Zn-dependent protease|nr:site-2 protease family protein [Rhodocyclaceae bacterium]MCP5296109.1 site-2 protease family protein [Zoogloeaceae bacterium]PKO71933.1 MAG: site-2 protease family protein [Betaproteobacteria bacterium HGW-Betaproteobacteria-14]MBX3676442.1 site-2 protease family protein [Rhodocyclaceae bacterium]MBZ0133226.1 site-2 protease family protein [Rhodocyclaceae bacterium]
MENLIQTLAIYAIPVLLAITLHEAAHGYVARHFGDPTAYLAGRISLNPLRHVDPVGTILVPGAILVASKLLGGSAMLFGWAKPVPVDFSRLRHPKRDMLWVAAAGPGTNLLMAIGWAALLKLVGSIPENGYSEPMARMALAGIEINAVLMLLNLLPIPPLDGGRIAVSLLPHRLAWQFSKLEPYGLAILLLLLFTDILGAILWPLMVAFRHLLAAIFQF